MRSERGQILPLVAVVLVTLMGLAAFAIDVGHAYLVKHQLQNAVDSAALAGAYDLPDTATALTDADGYAAANTPVNTGMAFVPTVNAGVLSVSGAVTIDTWFARVFGIDHFHVTAHAKAVAIPGGGRLVDDDYVVPTGYQVTASFKRTNGTHGTLTVGWTPDDFTTWYVVTCNNSTVCIPSQQGAAFLSSPGQHPPVALATGFGTTGRACRVQLIPLKNDVPQPAIPTIPVTATGDLC